MNNQSQSTSQPTMDQHNNEYQQNSGSWFRKLIIVLVIIGITAGSIFFLYKFKPEAKKREIPKTIVRVDTIDATRSSYPIIVSANGTIEAETRGNLVAQIRGEITSVSNNFKDGGSFKKGDVLIQIDRRDHQAELSQSLAQLSQAQATYSQEQANSEQALLDWRRLGNTTPAPDLVARKPQLSAAKAQLDSAKAANQTAKLNLTRTTLTAPYNGRIIERQAVLGQYVAIGSVVAEVFSTDGIEVRLPMSQEEFSQLGLDSFTTEKASNFDVTLSSAFGLKEYQWNAQISRINSTFDINTRQIDVFAKVEDPFGDKHGQPSLKIGQFVSATIKGRLVEDVFVIPNKSIREGSYVYVVRDEKLAKQSINIIWQDDQNALIAEGFDDGELIVTTSLNSTLAGSIAKLANEPKEAPERPNTEDQNSNEKASNTEQSTRKPKS